MSKNTPVHQTQNIFFIIFLSSSSASLPFLCELVLLCSLFNPAELTYGEKKSYLSSAAVTVPLQVAVETTQEPPQDFQFLFWTNPVPGKSFA